MESPAEGATYEVAPYFMGVRGATSNSVYVETPPSEPSGLALNTGMETLTWSDNS